MCPVCLATMGFYVAGAVSAGGITTCLAARCADEAIDTPMNRHPKEGGKTDGEAHDRNT